MVIFIKQQARRKFCADISDCWTLLNFDSYRTRAIARQNEKSACSPRWITVSTKVTPPDPNLLTKTFETCEVYIGNFLCVGNILFYSTLGNRYGTVGTWKIISPSLSCLNVGKVTEEQPDSLQLYCRRPAFVSPGAGGPREISTASELALSAVSPSLEVSTTIASACGGPSSMDSTDATRHPKIKRIKAHQN